MGMLVSSMALPASAGGQDFSDTMQIRAYMQYAADERAKGEYGRALEYLDAALVNAEEENNEKGKLRALIESALLRLTLNDFDIALELLFSAEELGEKLKDSAALAEIYNATGANYHMQDEYEKASDNYDKSLDLYLDLGKKTEIARAYSNIGVLWKDRNEPLTALKYHRKSLSFWEGMNEDSWVRVTMMHIGVAHKLLGNLDSANYYFTQIVDGVDDGKENQVLTAVFAELGDICIEGGKYIDALRWCQQGLDLASESTLLSSQMKNCECLYRAYEHLGQDKKALTYYKLYAAYKDSIFNNDKVKEMTRIEMGHQFERQQIVDSVRRSQEQLVLDLKHQEEIANERADRNIAMGLGLGILLLAAGLLSRLRYVRKAQRTIKKERDRSDNLLLNILPAEIASELKTNGKAKARRFREATILFTDFEHFTATAANMPPSALVEEINSCFTAFDKICDTHGIEKIKTIGDAYMAVGGIPVPKPQATSSVVRAALDMQEFIQDRARDRAIKGLSAFEMRAGIHLGPVVAGVVGVKKFQYDIWGDTVNTASRMESSGQVGRVNISQIVYERLKEEDDLQFEFRGCISVKGKGEIEMWFVDKAGQNP